MSKESILAADIGGTNTRLILSEVIVDDSIVKSGSKYAGSIVFQKKYLNQNYSQFTELLREFLKDSCVSRPPLTACFAVAGPVKNNVVRFTNRSWTIDGYVIE